MIFFEITLLKISWDSFIFQNFEFELSSLRLLEKEEENEGNILFRVLIDFFLKLGLLLFSLLIYLRKVAR